MTKAAMCLTCGQIIGPRRDGEWQWCAEPCTHAAVRWRDPVAGLLEVTAFHGEGDVLVLGLHNAFVGAASIRNDDDTWRRVHDRVTDAPGYLFDKSRRDCWAVLVHPGESRDVFFMPYSATWAQRAPTSEGAGDE